jgi:hypothetical protein
VAEFKTHDRVTWAYRHWTNGRTFTWRTKRGIFVGMVKYRPGGLYGPLQYSTTMALVWFDGNKRWSKVSLSELRAEEPDEGQANKSTLVSTERPE